ncbi:hypothetical protein Dda_3203 [Drechslerella dactyloides]|uniref:ER membrane protein complex subunit 2 n=1 Tax=Drechslerella dactyloides TaxID=74499 RepID=A0AAD6J394_DREDA|nr:hypothetical protein Dda_3203 [Drechslerella dactyloides]
MRTSRNTCANQQLPARDRYERDQGRTARILTASISIRLLTTSSPTPLASTTSTKMSLTSYLSRFISASTHPSPAESLSLSQLAPSILNLTISDTPEQWSLYESLLLSALRTGDDTSARLVLQRLSDRFGNENARIMALQGMFDEAIATNPAQLEQVLKNYDEVMKEDPTNVPVAKRRITLLHHLNKKPEAIAALVALIDLNPTDAESWSQLAQYYFEITMYSQAIYCLEEVLLILPNAYNVHARLGEINYIMADSGGGGGKDSVLERLEASLRWYLRSVELCDGYLRGYYGIKMVTAKLLQIKTGQRTIAEEKVNKLNSVATVHLNDIVSGSENGKKEFAGIDLAEVAAAKELLEADDRASRYHNTFIHSSTSFSASSCVKASVAASSGTYLRNIGTARCAPNPVANAGAEKVINVGQERLGGLGVRAGGEDGVPERVELVTALVEDTREVGVHLWRVEVVVVGGVLLFDKQVVEEEVQVLHVGDVAAGTDDGVGADL